jgi:hypothetical protein
MAPRPSRLTDVEKGLLLRSRFAQTLNVPRTKYASGLHSLRPCRKTLLNILKFNT